MKIKVFKSPEVEKEKEVEPVTLRLRENSDGSVALLAVNKSGARRWCGTLLTITDEGVRFAHSVNRGIGFPLERSQLRIVI